METMSIELLNTTGKAGKSGGAGQTMSNLVGSKLKQQTQPNGFNINSQEAQSLQNLQVPSQFNGAVPDIQAPSFSQQLESTKSIHSSTTPHSGK